MRRALACVVLLYLTTGVLAQTPPAPAPTGKLELPAPQTVSSGSGFIKIAATGGGKSIAYDVYAEFADTSVKAQAEVIGGILIVGIPSTTGIIRVTAAGVVDGAPVIASTTITIEPAKPAPGAAPPPSGAAPPPSSAAPPPSSAAPPPSSAAPPPSSAAPTLHVTVVGPEASDELRQALESAGCKYWPYAANDPRLAAKKLDKEVVKAGGTPCCIVQNAAGKVLAAKRISGPADVAGLVNDIRRAAK